MDFKKTILAAAVMCGVASNANAGGIITNTNQSVSFLRNPAREAAIGIDGVYSNPAGVMFMNEGFHIDLNWQCGWQTRTVETTSPYLDHTLKAVNGLAEIPTKRYRGHASAPCIPSVQAAYNKDKWSYQFGFAVVGGGGSCEFTKGIGTFENAIGQIATRLAPLGVKGYGVDNFMEGKQFYFGITVGAAYKVTDNLSVYGGLRGMIASANYKAQIKDIAVATSEGLQTLGDFLDSKNAYLANVVAQTQPYYEKYGSQYDALKAAVASGQAPAEYEALVAAIAGYQTAVGAQASLKQLEGYRNGLDLESDQSGFGISPIIGIDYKVGAFNFAAKYEFRTAMSLKNASNLKAATLAATGQFVDGTSVREDVPAFLALGAQYSPIEIVRLNAGYHHYYDRKANKTYFYADEAGKAVRSDSKNDLLKHGSNEYLGGVEVDLTNRLTVSSGFQITRYGNTEAYVSDISYVVDSWSFGFGASYQANPNVKLEAAYFKTTYDHYKTATSDYTRTADVIGVGCEISF